MKRIAAFTILALTACPQDDAPPLDGADEIETSADGPDLPVDSSTESDSETTSSTSDDESTGEESTEDSDGSTSESSSEGTDDDVGSTDGETGSEAVPTSLIVESAGQRIGYLMGVSAYGFLIWDDVNEITFNVNQQTGHVAGSSPPYYFQTVDCTGQRYQVAGYRAPPDCDQIPVPVRRSVIGSNANDSAGIDGSASLIAPTGPAVTIMSQSVMAGAQCVAVAASYCAYPVQDIAVIPETFTLPIVAAETVALP